MKKKKRIILKTLRNCFKDTIRSILITIDFLHYLRTNPKTLTKSLWNYLCKVFSSYRVRPLENDLLNYLCLMCEVTKRLYLVLEEKLGNKKPFNEEVQWQSYKLDFM